MYSTPDQALGALAGIEAIDYFMAIGLCEALDVDDPVIFHVFVALQQAQRQGHHCLVVTHIANKTMWQVSEDNSEKVYQGFRFPDLTTLQGKLAVYTPSAEDPQPVVFELDALYLRRYWQFETQAAEYFKRKVQELNLEVFAAAGFDECLNTLFPNEGDNKSNDIDWQKVACLNALPRGFSVISGGPGTGKTFTVTRLLALLLHAKPNAKVMLTAPTGKAAQRLNESIQSAVSQLVEQGLDGELAKKIPTDAMTLHRLLGVRPNSNQLRYHQDAPLPCDVLVIDEVSMVDLSLMTWVLRALKPSAQLIFVGDANQLPSVETGQVLADVSQTPHPGFNERTLKWLQPLVGQKLPQCDEISMDHLTVLQRSYRTIQSIGAMAKDVIQCQAATSWNKLFETKGDPAMSVCSNGDLSSWLTELVDSYFVPVQQSQSVKQAIACLSQFRILAAIRMGERGVENLNQLVEKQLRKRFPLVQSGQGYRGRPIMVTQNSYTTQLFNGDVGILWPNESGRLVAWFEKDNGELRQLPISRLPPFETVYAMTIHKTQGSEFTHVALVLPDVPSEILTPELIYTGITRAKKRLYLACTKPIWEQSLQHRVRRDSRLKQRIFESTFSPK